jgi:hypothetical protein
MIWLGSYLVERGWNMPCVPRAEHDREISIRRPRHPTLSVEAGQDAEEQIFASNPRNP